LERTKGLLRIWNEVNLEGMKDKFGI